MYGAAAVVYDTFSKGIPYEKWADNIIRLFEAHAAEPKLILDLGCGAGAFTVTLAKRGYEMIGVDSSADMLAIASAKAQKENLDILFINQDMRELELYGTADACVSVCDSLNHITDIADFIKTLSLVGNYLNPGGLFIFDVITRYYFETLGKRGVFGDVSDTCAFICETAYSPHKRIMEFCCNSFIKEEYSQNYRRVTDVYMERAYTLEEIKDSLSSAGLNFRAVYDENLKKPKDNTERLVILAKKGE